MTDSVPGPGDQHEDNAKDARVQVLTAEVRTLVVGSRQVTLSVYGQLDCGPHSQIKPFGRVHPKDADRSDIWVVGQHKADGALVRSRAPYQSEVLNWEPFQRAATDAGAVAVDAIRTAAEDALEAVVREVVRAFARLIQAKLFDRAHAADLLMREAKNAGLHTAGYIPGQIMLRIKEINAGTAEEPDGPFISKALSVIRAREQAEREAATAVATVRQAWSELPLIVLAGLR